MKICRLAWVVFALISVEASAAVRFVKAGNGSASPPYTTWATAAATIQDAVDASDPGDVVLVTNGLYQVGGRPDNYYGNDLTNRVLIDRAISVESVNGPSVTTILGNPVSGTAAVRCVNLGDNAVLNGFTLKNGGTMGYFYWAWVFGNFQQQSGAGVTASPSAIITNCIITACSAYVNGGGASGGLLRNCTMTNNAAPNGAGGGAINSALENCRILNNHSAGGGGGSEGGALTNCTLYGNSAGGNGGGAEGGLLVNCAIAGNVSQASGGGVSGCTANNCTLTGNTAVGAGGGASASTLNNSILANNSSVNGANFDGCTLNFCCATPLPDSGTNNFTADPQLLDSAHLKPGSPCIGAGSSIFSSGTDIDSEPRLNPPSVGCDEFYSGAASGSLFVSVQSAFTNVAAIYPAVLTSVILGHATNVIWSFGDGSFATNQLSVSHSFAAPGNFTIAVTAFNSSNPAGISATCLMQVVAQPAFYAKANNPTPAPPFNSWATAATNIQDAINVAIVPGSLVLVTNGVYINGGRTAYGSLTNRVAATIPLDIRSVNGPAVTTITGNPVIGGNAVRCVYLASGAQLTGFTLTNGATLDGGSLSLEQSGGAVRCESAYSTVSNCVISANVAFANGGGVEGGTILNSTLSSNTANSGGAGHGAALSNCVLSRNSANANGGAVSSSTVYNSALFANSSHVSGGAAEESTLVNCTVSGNSASISAGGVHNSTLNNCVVFFNNAARFVNFAGSVFSYCCTTPLPPHGANNITSDPQLTDGAHIGTGSPCIAAGSSAYISGADIDGEAWNSPPSIGCDESNTGAVTTALGVSVLAGYTNVSVGFPVNLSGLISGHATNSLWNFGDGSFAINQLYVAHSWASPGDYVVSFTAFNNANPAGVSGTISIHVTSQTIFYVAATNTNPAAPFNSWATAATNIQDAADVAAAGATVLVNDGFYQFGGRIAFGALTNRVALARALNLLSLNGPSTTIIAGNYVNDNTAVRGVSLVNGCSMTGFTVTNGATRGAGDLNLEQSGAGIWCESTNVFVTNCVVSTCSAPQYGGGAFYGTFQNCTFTNCSAGSGGGAYSAVLNNSSLIGNYGNGAVQCLLNQSTLIANSGCGAVSSVLSNCTVSGNSSDNGGGVNSCTVFDSTISGNSANTGGGAVSSTLVSCVLSNNSAGVAGGAAQSCTLSNCTLVANSAGNNGGAANLSTLQFCTLLNNSVSGDGGGAYDCLLSDCLLNGNQSGGYGGGACVSSLTRCTLSANSANEGGGYSGLSSYGSGRSNFVSACAVFANSANAGGGVDNCPAVNCTITGNSAKLNGGGSENATLANCIVYHNDAVVGPEYHSSTLNYCCTLPLPPTGSGNITSEPLLADFAHISASSPCRAAGSAAYASGTDIDGDPWANPPSIGCDEFNAASATGSLAVSILADFTNCAAGFTVHFGGQIVGHATSNLWNFGDGTLATNQPYLGHSWVSGGNYPVTFTAFNASNPGGVSASLVIHVSLNPIYYVSLTSTNPVPPFNSWATAATNIQDAADVALPGGTVIVTNGVYRDGGRFAAGSLSNRVSIVTPINVRSVNGPAVSAIEGFPVGDYTAIRCVYLTNGASLSGFTLTNGATRGDSYDARDYNGAGIWCESYRASVSNCVLIGNIGTGNGGGGYNGTFDNCTFLNNSSWSGGGADSSVLRNCVFSNNACIYGGGASSSTLTNCVLIGNQTLHDSDYTENGGGAAGSTLANCVLKNNLSLRGGGASGCSLLNCTVIYNSTKGDVGGGVLSCALTNCIVYFNQAPNGTNYSDDSTLYFCDTFPMPTNGANNIVADPALADTFHISSTSPCRGAGTAAATSGVDIDGDAWLNPPSIGADEFNSGSATGALAAAFSETFTNAIPGLLIDFNAQVSGHATVNRWNFGDGTLVTNQLVLSHSWNAPGNYVVTFTAYNADHPAGVSAAVTIYILANPVQYVSLNNPNPAPPYFSWATAATNIQDALEVAFAGGTVMVSNGVYQTGGLRVFENSTNRVAVAKPLALQSVNGAGATVIDGGHAMRCLFLTNNVTVSGFTLVNGVGNNGGGVFCENNDVLNDCAFISNSTPADYTSGGGGYRGIYNRCTFAGNSASYFGAAAVYAGLNFCVVSNNGPASYGGAAVQSSLNRCLILSNSAAWGGGVENCEADNCLLLGNSATYGGGGAIWSVENNCTIVGNYAPLASPGYYSGAGVYDGTANNCIIYYNIGDNCTADFEGLTLNHCCTTPDPGGIMNITFAPLFANLAANDFHLKTNSPCINAGNNAFAFGTNDLEGVNRIAGGTVDIGAYEFPNPTSLLSYAWAQQFGFATDGYADFADPDADHMNNWQEWIAGTNPTNAASFLKMLSPSNSTAGLTVTWQSVNGVNYFLQRSPNLGAPGTFANLQTNIPGQPGTTSYTDTNAIGVPFFYRVGVEH